VTKIFEGTLGQYNTNVILSDGKVGIECPMPSDLRHPYHWIVLGKRVKTAHITKDFTRFELDTNPIPAIVKICIVYQISLALDTLRHPYHWIVLRKRVKTANITKDFTRFELDTYPILANGKISSEYQISLALDTLRHPYHWIELVKRVKTADITTDFTRFELNTYPIPANGKISIEYQISLALHWIPYAILTIE
jgi:hypothetical protein